MVQPIVDLSPKHQFFFSMHILSPTSRCKIISDFTIQAHINQPKHNLTKTRKHIIRKVIKLIFDLGCICPWANLTWSDILYMKTFGINAIVNFFILFYIINIGNVGRKTQGLTSKKKKKTVFLRENYGGKMSCFYSIQTTYEVTSSAPSFRVSRA